ncbi:putative Maintenance of ploidy protein mob1 [Blattamonas nauphoetae]|uniref:Maintenance of ploidy protein mob1 n=1 Tax=Blattamonas nauphoetae TaxID=2049346 RepID=A0ABQ9X282_9EUKA|nr:putative Maintenance of ploidy protein mob1 [Blattamonas nauphoetae]KAK2945042.1 putative Maintenance of ploidy protein mob1 [Blattamonas nauphoetae]
MFSNKTMRQVKGAKVDEKHRQELLKHINTTLGSGNLREAVALPEGEDLNEWLAVNTFDFFNQINMLYGTITEFCTKESCPMMTAGPNFEYRWADGKKIKKPVALSAPEYVDELMTWVQELLDDETLFPSKIGVPFPKNFKDTVKNIYKRLFRVYAHIYHAHLQKIVQLGEEAHLNTCFKHFLFFVKEFDLISNSELAPLEDLVKTFMADS